MGMADNVGWFDATNKYAVLLMEQEVRNSANPEEPRPMKIVTNGTILADTVQVVRCKHCEHWKDWLPDCTEHQKFCEIGFYKIGENGYCSYGERREDIA